jgi:hypothetical protein
MKIKKLTQEQFNASTNKDRRAYTNSLSEKEQIKLIRNTDILPVIAYIDNPSEKLQLATINKFDGDLRYIKNPTEKVKLKAVKYYFRSMEYISNPSKKLQIATVKNLKHYNDKWVYEYIKSEKALKLYEKLKKVKNII